MIEYCDFYRLQIQDGSIFQLVVKSIISLPQLSSRTSWLLEKHNVLT